MNPTARKKHLYPAIALWLTVCLLHALAWRAGFVTDAIDWLHDAQTLPLKDYLSRSNSTVHALYYTTQLVTLGIYKLFGTAPLPWFLLFATMQAGAAYLLYVLFSSIFRFANLPKPRRIAFWGAAMFCVSPYISEVIIWKACFHYLQGLLLMLGVLVCMQRFLHSEHNRRRWVVFAVVLYLLSVFALEISYLTPLLTALLLLYYRRIGWFDAVLRRAWIWFFVPQACMLILQLCLFHYTYGEWSSHGTGSALSVSLKDHLANGLKYAFHLFCFGRFWSQEWKEKVYMLCEKPFVLVFCYSILLIKLAWLHRRSRKGYGTEQVGFMLLLWTMLAMILALPMPLERLFDLSGNRYLYLVIAFGSMMFSLFGHAMKWRWLTVGVGSTWIVISACLTLRTSRHWQTSERIASDLLQNVEQADSSTTILLAMPYCYKGVPMINSWPHGNFARMHDVLCPQPLKGKVCDAMAFNMIAPSDGAEAKFVNDSTVRVTLLQWGTWWWYMDFGGRSYETPDYRIDMRDQGHTYDLVLKRPAGQYRLLCQVGDKWKLVNADKGFAHTGRPVSEPAPLFKPKDH